MFVHPNAGDVESAVAHLEPIRSAGSRPASGLPFPAPWLVRYLTWPALFVANLTIISLAIVEHWNLTATMAATTGTFIVVLVALEFADPLDARWRMTLRTFFGLQGLVSHCNFDLRAGWAP
jgi:hypothetical protein